MDQVRDGTLTEPLSTAFEREHRVIDDGILAAVDAPADRTGRQPLADAIHALRRHIYAEEELMFPALRDAGVVGPVLVMLREHAEMWPLLDTVEQSAAEDDVPVLREACASLLDLLTRPNPKEEAILYPQADTLLEPGAASILRQLLVSGDLPTGWRCQHLR